MTAAVKLTTTTTAPEPLSLQLPCPMCGEPQANLCLSLVDQSMTCQECEDEFTIADVENLISRWRPALAWLRAMPTTAQHDGSNGSI